MQHEHGREIVLACKGVFLGSTTPRKKRVSPSKQRPVCVWPMGRDAGVLRADAGCTVMRLGPALQS